VRQLEWMEDKEQAIAYRDMYAKIVKALGMTKTHGVGIEPFQGGWRVYVTARDTH
jgi:hypothetical protein